MQVDLYIIVEGINIHVSFLSCETTKRSNIDMIMKVHTLVLNILFVYVRKTGHVGFLISMPKPY